MRSGARSRNAGRDGFGADADHIQRAEEIEPFAAAGYTMYTLDPHSSVDETADSLAADALPAKLDELPWDALEDDRDALLARYREPVELDREAFRSTPEDRGARGRQVRPRARARRRSSTRLCASGSGRAPSRSRCPSTRATRRRARPSTSTSRASSIASASTFTSLAPRFPGAFEKGVEFVGDLDELASRAHGARRPRARLGDYKLSLHSGSDKFSVYPLFAEATRGKFHVKTSGTSYLEALRVVAGVEPALFREIYALARSRYQVDRATYHVSAELSRASRRERRRRRGARTRCSTTANVAPDPARDVRVGARRPAGGEENHLRQELARGSRAPARPLPQHIERHFAAHLAGLRLARTWNG